MATNSKQNTPNQDEIDLLTLFEKMGEFLKKSFLGLANLIVSVLIFLLRKWYFFAIAIVLTILTAYTLNKAAEPFYQSDMVLRANATANQSMMVSLNKLGQYAETENYDALSKELNLSMEEAMSIKGIETFWYYDMGDDGIYDGIDLERRYISDTSVVLIEDEFVVRARIFDPGIIENLEDQLVNYLESNPILKALNEQRLKDLVSSIKQTDYEIEKLDSLQKREYFTNPENLRQSEGQIVFTSEKIVETYHNDMFRLLRIKQNYEQDLNIYSSVATVMEGFSIPNKPNKDMKKYANQFLWYYLGLALILSIVITYRKKIWTSEA